MRYNSNIFLTLVLLCITSPITATVVPKQPSHIHKRDAAHTVITTVTKWVYEDKSTTAASSVESVSLVDKNVVAASSESASSTSTVASSSPVASSSSAAAQSSSAPASSSSSSSSGGIDGDLASFVDPTKKFEDGVISCSDGVPTGDGVIALNWLGYNGWASITNDAGNTVSNCQDGYYCSYACQAGMSKTQWPSSQPSDGQSRGGLLCKNGKLYRTNTNTEYLCEWGKQSANAVSKVDKVVSLCRTDYPGSENIIVPTRLTAGSSKPMSVVDGSSYYQWEGKQTSSQYYVNNAGTDVEQGCVWGSASAGVGNWAPVVLGAGFSNGNTYLSVIPNPNNKTPPNYNVKIVAADSDSVINGNCDYSNGKYNGDGTAGCTVTVTKGSANFVFY